MPSKSKTQQRFFGMVDAYKKGEMKNASSKIKKAAKGMSMNDVKDFAETKHKGLPEKVEEQTIIRLTESDLHRIVKESVNRILDEGWGSYVDYYYQDNEKEPKENNCFNSEKEEREPSKSSRVRRREYMKNKQKMEQS